MRYFGTNKEQENRDQFSGKEQELFIALGLEYLLDTMDRPPKAYSLAIEICFLFPEKIQNQKAIDSLRRCGIHLHNNGFRKSKKFDKLIRL